VPVPWPTRFPTPVPTPVPTTPATPTTSSGSREPTLAPTPGTCGAQVLAVELAKARPRLTVASGAAFPLASRTVFGSNGFGFGGSFGGGFGFGVGGGSCGVIDGGEESEAAATCGGAFGLLSGGSAPGSAFSLAATLVGPGAVGSSSSDGSRPASPGVATGRTEADPASRVTVALKTPTAYSDFSTVEVAYQLFDDHGRTTVLTTSASGLAVSLTLNRLSDTHDPASEVADTASSACGSPDAVTGVGLCFLAVATGWFGGDADRVAVGTVEVWYGGVGGALVASSPSLPGEPGGAGALRVTLAASPAFTAAAGGIGMVATLPRHPVLAGDTVSVPVTARTGEQDLSVWVLRCTVDPAVLVFAEAQSSTLFVAAVASATDGGATITISTSGVSSGTTAAQVKRCSP